MREGLRRLLAKPPDPAAELVPTGRFGSLEAILKRAEIARLAGTKQDLRAWVHKEWSFDGYQWLVMMAAHLERHPLQIREVKASIR